MVTRYFNETNKKLKNTEFVFNSSYNFMNQTHMRLHVKFTTKIFITEFASEISYFPTFIFKMLINGRQILVVFAAILRTYVAERCASYMTIFRLP